MPPLFYESGYVYHRTLGSCFVNTPSPSRHHWYGGLVVCVLFYAPLCVMLYSYAHIYRIARTQSSRIAATMIRMACLVQAPLAINGQAAGAGPATIKGTKAMLTILQLLGTFMLTYIPYSVVFVAGLCGLKVCNFPVLVAVFSTIYQAAPVTNGAIYGIRNKLLRNSFRRYVRRRIQQLCYKDKRRNSVKRSSSFRLSVMQRKTQPNGNSQPGLRRTQSLQAKHMRSPSPNLLQLRGEDRIKKAQSFTLANGHTMAFLDPNILSAPANEISNDSVTPLEVLAESEQDRDDP
ncbi:hypothetical protein FSP39_019073 [Pinctada imbricata]|uniref:G-protein coupled receptors family 1 profile domain-containing protein n=1 Tax=Pinctada imbricata TaxID=66713 RepID=A0AA88XLH9_PINIB|nr:hypothetical protein FSP39_019073 [Pinctada imbricata]